MSQISEERKKRIIQEGKEVGNIAAVCRKHGIPKSTVYSWIKKAEKIDNTDENLSKNSKVKRLEKEIAEQKLEIEILKDLLKKTSHAWLGE